MRPEEARGAAVDKRADIWAFGCVLYKMLTGKPAFKGATTSDVLAAVMRDEPDLSQVPTKVRPLLKRCLEKEPQRRLRHIGDAMEIIESTPGPEGAPQPALSRLVWTLVVVTTVLLAVLGLLAFVHFRETPPEARLMITSIPPPENTSFDFARGSASSQLALSPDGRRIAFPARGTDGEIPLWVRPLDSSAAQLLVVTQGGIFRCCSPDSRSIA